MAAVIVPKLIVELPPGWTEAPPGANAPLTYVAGTEPDAFTLQVSAMRHADAASLQVDPDLGHRSWAIGNALGWSDHVTSAWGDCAFGRFGKSVFTTPFLTSAVWVLVRDEMHALVWTLLGSKVADVRIAQAENIIMTAKLFEALA